MRYVIHGSDAATRQPRSETITSAISVKDAVAQAQSMGVHVISVEECATPQRTLAPRSVSGATDDDTARDNGNLGLGNVLGMALATGWAAICCHRWCGGSKAQVRPIRPAAKGRQGLLT